MCIYKMIGWEKMSAESESVPALLLTDDVLNLWGQWR